MLRDYVLSLEKISPFLLISPPKCPAALLCACTSCSQANYTCETDGACMVSIFNLDGMEHHVRTCIPKVELVPAGKPFYCLSSEDLRNTHCCYTDFCNKIDLRVPSGEWTLVGLLAHLGGRAPHPFVLLCSSPVLWLYDRQRCLCMLLEETKGNSSRQSFRKIREADFQVCPRDTSCGWGSC